MGLMIDGKWVAAEFKAPTKKGHFVRAASSFRDWIKKDGSSGFPPEANRYHLYVSLACPWAHRTLIFRKLKGLEQVVSYSVVDPIMLDGGWEFKEQPSYVPSAVANLTRLHQIYSLAASDYTGRVTVPVLWDKKVDKAVNNESSEIIRMLNHEFGELAQGLDYYPAHLRTEIDLINEEVYSEINNGVYKCGFANTQDAYEAAFNGLFAALDRLEQRLDRQRYLVGDQITEADWRLFTTLIRFDAVYVCHFKCNHKRIADYPNLQCYLKELYQWPGIKETCDFEHIKRHYFGSHRSLNPHGIVPVGPTLDLDSPHLRDTEASKHIE